MNFVSDFSVSLIFFALFASQALALRKSCPDEYGNIFVTKKLEGNCPKISYITNLNRTNFYGAFYRTYSTDFGEAGGCDGTCITEYLARWDEDVINLSACCKKGCTTVCSSSIGSGLYTFSSKEPGVIVGGSPPLDNYILDYGPNHVIYYLCGDPKDGPKAEYVYIDTRYPTINLPLKNRIFQVLRKNNVDVSKVNYIPHSLIDCHYSFFS